MARDVSVIVPTYRRPALLPEAVRSALAQEGVTVEVIVVDDCPDGSGRAATEAIGDARVTYKKRERSSGGNPCEVRNDGWPLAQGRHVLFLDDDDRLAEGALPALARVLDQRPDCAYAFGRVEPFGGDAPSMLHEVAYFLDAAHRARQAEWTHSRAFMLSTLLFEAAPLVTSACLFRRERIVELGGFAPAVRLTGITDLCVRATRKHGFAFVDQVVAQYRFDRASFTHDERNHGEWVRSYDLMYKRYRQAHGTLEFLALKGFARTLKRFL